MFAEDREENCTGKGLITSDFRAKRRKICAAPTFKIRQQFEMISRNDTIRQETIDTKAYRSTCVCIRERKKLHERKQREKVYQLTELASPKQIVRYAAGPVAPRCPFSMARCVKNMHRRVVFFLDV